MFRDDDVWMAKFSEGIEQAKRCVRFCVKLYAEFITQQLGLGDGKTAAAPGVDMPKTNVVRGGRGRDIGS